MSVERRHASDGSARYVVRWREDDKNRAKTFARRKDADAWDAEVVRRRRLGSLGMVEHGKSTLSELREEWWAMHRRDLSPKSVQLGEGAWRVHLRDQLGKRRIGEIDVRTVERWAHERLAAGAGEASVEKAWLLLGQMLGRGVAWGWIGSNPVRLAKRPKKKTVRVTPRIMTPEEIERTRSHLGARDATFVSVIGYAGLRPGEALALRWSDIGATHISVSKGLSMGEIRSTKTGKARRVPMIRQLRGDLAAWRLESSHSDDDDLVFPNFRGDVMSEADTRMWAGRRFRPALLAAGIADKVRVYDLRHTACSLAIASGLNVIEVAKQMGHSPSMTLDVYGHVFEEWEGKGPIDLAEEIRRARAA